jgi:hypothetical protein
LLGYEPRAKRAAGDLLPTLAGPNAAPCFMPEIARKLTIKSGKNAGKPPSVASLYRALAEAADSDTLAGEALSLRPPPGSPDPAAAPIPN